MILSAKGCQIGSGLAKLPENTAMAKGLEKHQARQAALNLLGKDLTRRSGAKCELCEASGTPLRVFEVPPEEEEPDLDKCIFLCGNCSEQLSNPKRLDVGHWRCACQSVWSEVPAVQVMAARVLDRLGKTELWAREALEDVYFEEDIESWIASKPL